MVTEVLDGLYMRKVLARMNVRIIETCWRFSDSCMDHN